MDQDFSSNVLGQAVAWLHDDPDPHTRAELQQLIDEALSGARPVADTALAELSDRFHGPLQFGTAGLRAPMGAGEHRMNRAVVIRAAWGIANYLNSVVNEKGKVVIGYDARHNSEIFARDSAGVLGAAGCEVVLLPAALPTPILAFAVRDLGADVGIMVTASHNPPEDNGYKVFLGGRVQTGPGQGAQLTSPTDASIASKIAAAPPAVAIPLHSSGWQVADEGLLERYFERLHHLHEPHDDTLIIASTALHGVGAACLARALKEAGFSHHHGVKRQDEPDGSFPTVSFPNPEEAGAMDLVMQKGRRVGAQVVLANDPDADRCSVAIPDPATGPGYRQLTGDEVGVLLAYDALQRHFRHSQAPAVVASTIVSSRWVQAVAQAHGATTVQTLTGFKWLSRVPGLTYAYEEALGYCVDPEAVRDKDGISAAVAICLLAQRLASRGQSLGDLLDELAMRHGVFTTRNFSLRFSDLEERGRLMAATARHRVATLLGQDCENHDLSRPQDELPPTDGVRWQTSSARVVIRPSGTEPKLKCYLETVATVQEPNAVGEASSSDTSIGAAGARSSAAAAPDSLAQARERAAAASEELERTVRQILSSLA